MSLIASIEDDIIAQAKTLFGARLRAVESLPGDWDDETLKRVLRNVPGMYVVFAGGTPAQPGALTARITASFLVYAVTGHASGEAARRRGDSLQIGAYEILELLIPRLHGHVVPNIGTLIFAGVQNLFTGAIDKQGVAVYAAQFQMQLLWPADLDLSTLDPFVTFDGKIDMAPMDGQIDAEDTIQLAQ